MEILLAAVACERLPGYQGFGRRLAISHLIDVMPIRLVNVKDEAECDTLQ